MYKLYTVWSDENSRKKVSARLYRDTFYIKFNLGFGMPDQTPAAFVTEAVKV